MNYRRVLLLTELGEDVRCETAAIRRAAPLAERLVVVARTPAARLAWFSGPAPADLNDAATASLERLRREVAPLAPSIELILAPDLETGHLTRVVEQERIDLVVTETPSIRESAVMSELRRRRNVTLLRAAPVRTEQNDVVCVAFAHRARASIAAFLRDHGDPALEVLVLTTGTVGGDDLASSLQIAGIEARVQVAEAGFSMLGEIVSGARPVGLLVLARFPPRLLFGSDSPAPVLVLPSIVSPPAALRSIDVPDAVAHSGTIRVRVEYGASAGRNAPIPDQKVAFVSHGRVAATVETRDGDAELHGIPEDTVSLGIYRMTGREDAEPLAAIETSLRIVRPGSRPLILFDANAGDEDLPLLAKVEASGAADLIAVRLRPVKSCRASRSRLRGAAIVAPVIDASVVLDEGDAFDVPDSVDPVRLARTGASMDAAGFPVVAIVYCGPRAPATIGFEALRPEELEGREWQLPAHLPEPSSLDRRLRATTGAPLLAGNDVELELDNTTARRWLLDAIANSRERVHLQVYMAADDAVGRNVEEALVAATSRGVAVRLLVDSLHALHGSLGATNALLQRLENRPGIELRVSRPVTGLPSLEDLKQRDHRKLIVVDGALALVGGRNLSHEYYTGFDEVPLSETSLWRDVPWLDAGARVRGPAVQAIERSFLEAWLEAGGAPFGLPAATPCGSASVRVVTHRGLRDARTLEAYLALIDTAGSHVYAVNGFPLILEIQHALLRALTRGVRVRTLFGHLTPMHGGIPFEGSWSSARTAATELVRSRMDALVAAGAEAYQLVVPRHPAWAPTLGAVSPHVHAKVLSADGRACAVGSANLDITAGYWESELLLLVEDERIAGELETHLDVLMAASERVRRDDPGWQQSARRRRWMRHWPGVLSV